MKLRGLQPRLAPVLAWAVTIRAFESQRRLAREWDPLIHFLKTPWFERP